MTRRQTESFSEQIGRAFVDGLHDEWIRIADDHRATTWRDIGAGERAAICAVICGLLDKGVIALGPNLVPMGGQEMKNADEKGGTASE